MADAVNNTEKAPWIVRQLGGTAISAGMTAAGGAVWSIYKKTPVMGGMKGGALLGVVASLGFGGMIYDSFFGPKKSFVAQVENEKATAQQGVAR